MSTGSARSRTFVPTSAWSARRLALLCVVAVAAALVAPLPGQAAAGPTVVSLTFDDGTSSNYQASADLVAHGMRGTFFVNTGTIGTSGSLTQGQLQQMAADGHEIGGHTVLHADLVTVSPDEARREVCNDRTTLSSWGLRPTSFAYPYSALTPQVEDVARDCGYNSARQVGSVRSPETCPDCALSESIPPRNPYFTRAPDSVLDSWSLADMQGLVTQAEESGGGWVQVVFHHICTGCGEYGVAPTTFNAFLDWLQTRASNGTVVQTVDQVIGGGLQPMVAGPASAPAAGLGVNGLSNPGLESAGSSSSVPECWQAAGSGTNTATFGRTSGAHSGSVAEKVTMSAYTSGDRKLLPRLDLGECAPAVTAGHRYDLSAWYRSTSGTAFAVFSRNAVGQWGYWTSSPALPASSAWESAAFTTPAVPTGVTALSFGLVIKSVGTLTTDDYALVDTTPPLDATLPTVSVTAPSGGETVSGPLWLGASASDDVGVSRVEFLIDGALVGASSASPYSSSWDSTSVANGEHTVVAQAFDAAGNKGVSSPVVVSVSNAARNLLVNPGLEAWTGTSPDCWQFGSAGTNTGSGVRSAAARSGSSAVQVSVSAWTSGDRKLVSRQDAGACAPAATPGHRYAVSAWITSSASSSLVVFYRDASGVWRYWATSPARPAAPSWEQAAWLTPALPAGATAISFGPALTGVGTLTMDDLSLVDQG